MKDSNLQHLCVIKRNLSLLVLAALILSAGAARAGELGHYNPGIANIRDFIVPEPGFYLMFYNYYYTSNRLNDRNGDRVSSVTIKPGPGPGFNLKVDVDVDIYAFSPMFVWVSPWKVAGARYAAYIAPSFATSSLGASLTAVTGRGISSELNSDFGMGDLLMQPVWLDWSLKHWDFMFGYGFYAPAGRYNLKTITFPIIGPRTVEAADNIGLGFWTHQFQGTAAWYPWQNKGTAVVTTLTYETNQKKDGFDITPGSHLTLNWGISQYLPLTKDGHLLAEIGPAGYSQWKITGDTGKDAINGEVLDQVHAAGGQLGLTYVPWNAALNFHYYYEFASKARFQGQVLDLSLALKF